MVFIPLSEEAILSSLASLIPDTSDVPPILIDVLQSVDSTNNYLKLQPAQTKLYLCCAEQQTAGRGRFSRNWSSPFGKNIYLSLRTILSCNLSQLSGLSLVVCLSLIKALKLENLQAKWPNDIICQGKKCSGILLEIVRADMEKTDLVIGIGLNVNEEASSQNPWTSLRQITQKSYDRNVLISTITATLMHDLMEFCQFGFLSFMDCFKKYDCLRGKEISLSQPQGSKQGICRGINSEGHLCLEDSTGKLHYLSSGDTTLSGKFVLS